MKPNIARSKAKLLLAVAVAALVVATAAMWNRSAVSAGGPIVVSDPPLYDQTGIITLAPGQTARLSVGNLGTAPVLVELMFIDQDGSSLAQDRRLVEPGQIAFHDLVAPGRTAGPIGAGWMLVDDKGKGPAITATLEAISNDVPDLGQSKMGMRLNHNETLVRDTASLN